MREWTEEEYEKEAGRLGWTVEYLKTKMKKKGFRKVLERIKLLERFNNFGSDSGGDFLDRSKRKYTFRIQHIENILPTISEKLLHDILISIKKHYEHKVSYIDSMLKLLMKTNELNEQYTDSDSKLNNQYLIYQQKYFVLERKVHFKPTFSFSSKDEISGESESYEVSVESILNMLSQFEGLLPSITEQWLKDILIGLRENLYKYKLKHKKSKREREIERIFKKGEWTRGSQKKREWEESLSTFDFTFKIMMLGDSPILKSTVTLRYISGFFMEPPKLTIGVDLYSKTTLFNGKKVKLQIWDSGGVERLRFLYPTYVKGADGAIFLYDIADRSTLNNIHEWIQMLKKNAGNIPIVLAGIFIELEEDRAVTYDEGLKLVKKYNLDGFVEVSPKTGQNIEGLFNLVKQLVVPS